jgi:hypothetical protein
MTSRGPRYNSTSTPSRTAVLGCSSIASKTEMFDDEAVARNAHRGTQRQIPQEPGDRRPYLHDGRRECEGRGVRFKGARQSDGLRRLQHGQRSAPRARLRSFELEGEKLFWKIDYYDLAGEFGSEDPTDPKKTLRVLTIMLAEEY